MLAAMLMKERAVPAENPQGMMMMEPLTAIEVQQLQVEIADLAAQGPPPLPMAMAVRDGQPMNVKVHIRGDPEKLGDEAPRGFLTELKHVSSKMRLPEDSSGRLELADWIASENNPLTPRVMVNRVWQHLFGRGLVASSDNFGSMGEPPSHPELLDYLASEFVREGWSTKKLIRRIMLSEAYHRSCDFDAANYGTDPENVYLWRVNRRRLDAESLRDGILAVTGDLDRTIGGTPVNEQTPQPMANVPEARRRSIYLQVFRENLHELFQVFDFPDPNALAGRRFVTTAPTQALYLMNSEFMAERSGRWAEKLQSETGRSPAELIAEVYAMAYARQPSASEVERAERFIDEFERALAQAEPDAGTRRMKSWKAFCHAILESSEFRYIN